MRSQTGASMGRGCGGPDHTTVNRQSARLESITGWPLPRAVTAHPDRQHRFVFGAGQWLSERHRHARRQWRKLHLGLDAGSRQIVAVSWTEQDLSDEPQVAALLAQIQSPTG
jgi:hypothetical protein